MKVVSYRTFLLESELESLLNNVNEAGLSDWLGQFKNWAKKITSKDEAQYLIGKIIDGIRNQPAEYKKNILKTIIPIIMAVPFVDSGMLKSTFGSDPETKQIVSTITAHQTQPQAMSVNKEDQLFVDYEQDAAIYLKRFPGSPITPEMLASSAEKTYKKTGVLVPLDLALAQGQIESGLGSDKNHRNPTTNPFSVGEYDDRTGMRFKNTQDGVQAYYSLMAKDYLKTRDRESLLSNFVNYDGERYATDPNYEKKLQTQVNFINKYISQNKNDRLTAKI